jgi:quercetin dioxygenase-like cupin family protein
MDAKAAAAKPVDAAALETRALRNQAGGATPRTTMSTRAPAIATLKIDEPHVRVYEYRFAPGAETGWHRHQHDYVVVPLLDGALLLEEPGGGSRTAALKAHQPYTRLAGVEHNVVNANAYEFAFLEVELLR